MRSSIWKLLVLQCCLLRQAVARVGTTDPDRSLKKHKDDKPTFCSAKGKPIFEEGEFNMFAFNKKFDPKCSCVDENNSVRLMSKLQDTVGTPNFLEVFERTVGDFRGEKSYECINGCEVCLETDDDEDSICGILETTVLYKFGAAKKNEKFDLREILSGAVLEGLEPQHMLSKPDHELEFCIKYTSGQEGRLCFGAELKASKEDEQSCFVGHDGKRCTSCERYEKDGQHCMAADCSNLGATETLDTCSNQGLTGMFEILDVFFNKSAPVFKVGTCGDFTAMHNN